MNIINEELEVQKFIERYNIVPTNDERTLLKLAIIHGAMAYNEWQIKKYRIDDGN